MKRMSVTLHFIELLLTLIKGKIGLTDALYILSGKRIERHVRESAGALLVLMKRGRGFSESLSLIKNGMVKFNSMYITLISAAELTGSVDYVLEQISKDLKKQKKAADNAFNILIYPVIVIIIAITGTLFLVFKGMPIFIAGGFLSNEIINNSVKSIIIAGIALLTGGIILFYAYFKIFFNGSNEFRIFYMMDFLLKNKVTMIDTLTQCIKGINDIKYVSLLIKIKKDIINGISFSQAFNKMPYLSQYIKAWLSMADMNGNICEICGYLKDYYAEKDMKKREVFTRLIEPSVIILTGSYLLVLILNVIMPILTFAGGII